MEELDPTEIQTLYDQFDGEEHENGEPERLQISKIIDHKWDNGTLLFTVRYYDSAEDETTLEQPFSVLRRDVPVECARYIRLYVTDSDRRKGYHTEWATKTIKMHTRAVKRLYAAYNVNRTMRLMNTRRAQLNRTYPIGTHQSTMKPKKKNPRFGPTEKFGLEVPYNTREALMLDKKNKNTKWADAIAKEMNGLDRLGVFEYHSANTTFS
jgi:hypothetical protein